MQHNAKPLIERILGGAILTFGMLIYPATAEQPTQGLDAGSKSPVACRLSLRPSKPRTENSSLVEEPAAKAQIINQPHTYRLPPVNDLQVRFDTIPHRLEGEYSIRTHRAKELSSRNGTLHHPVPPIDAIRSEPDVPVPRDHALVREPATQPNPRESDPTRIARTDMIIREVSERRIGEPDEHVHAPPGTAAPTNSQFIAAQKAMRNKHAEPKTPQNGGMVIIPVPPIDHPNGLATKRPIPSNLVSADKRTRSSLVPSPVLATNAQEADSPKCRSDLGGTICESLPPPAVAAPEQQQPPRTEISTRRLTEVPESLRTQRVITEPVSVAKSRRRF